MGIFGEDRPVSSVNAGHDRRLVILQLRVVRQVLGIDIDQPADAEGGDDEDDRARREEEAEKPGEKTHSISLSHLSRRRDAVACEILAESEKTLAEPSNRNAPIASPHAASHAKNAASATGRVDLIP